MMEKSALAGEVAGACPPFHSTCIYHYVQSCSVRSSWEGRYTPPISCLPIYVLCGPDHRKEKDGREIGGVYLPSHLGRTPQLCSWWKIEWKGGGCEPPTLTRLGWIYHHDEMHARKWPLPVYSTLSSVFLIAKCSPCFPCLKNGDSGILQLQGPTFLCEYDSINDALVSMQSIFQK